LTDELPVGSTHKGVAIFAGQSAKRVALIRREIDKVTKISDLTQLYEIAGDCSWSPEARLFAEARCIAGLQLATERRQARPDIDKEDVVACTAGLAVLDGRTRTNIALFLIRITSALCRARSRRRTWSSW